MGLCGRFVRGELHIFKCYKLFFSFLKFKTMSEINFYNIDCVEFMKTKPDNYYDLAIVDPPYGISVNMNAGRKKDTKSKKRTVKKWDNETPSEEYFNELFRVSKNQIIFGANHMIDKIQKKLTRLDFLG